jgi:hypothetical protein
MRFNGSTASVYSNQAVGGNDGSTPFSGQGSAATSASMAEVLKGGDAATYGGYFDVTIPFYTGTSFFKGWLCHYTMLNNTTITSLFDIMNTGMWASTSAITQIDLILATGSFVAGSQINLYGIS